MKWCLDCIDWNAVAAIGTVGAVAYSIFHESLWQWWRRPRLSLAAELKLPHSQKMTDRDGRSSYCLRLWLTNSGLDPADFAQVYVARVLRHEKDQKWEERENFMPMYLLWAHTGKDHAERIQRGMGRHCEFGVVLQDSSDELVLVTEAQPFTEFNVLGPGTYLVQLVFAAANVSPSTVVLEVNFTGRWEDSEEDMFASGVTIREVGRGRLKAASRDEAASARSGASR